MIIGIMGKAGHGKDTLANLIQRHIFSTDDKSCLIQPMAYAVKQVTSLVFNIPLLDLEDRDIKESVHPNTYGMTVRKVMQLVGTELFRNGINDNIWVDRQARLVKEWIEDVSGCTVVIPDIRFQNEIDMVKELGGVIVKVTRPEATEISSSNHVSEALASTAEADYYINNDSDLEHLEEEALNLLRELKLCD